MVCSANSVSAQTLRDVVTFLLTNRTVATDDFVRDQQAAKSASDAVTGFLLIDLNALPISTSAGGFTYRLDPEIGISVRSSDSFDPFFTRRALTAGAQQVTFGVSYQQSSFRTIDGRALRNGSLISTASRLRGQADYFDVETVAMRLEVDTATMVANAGVTDRFEVGAALPMVRITLDGQRQDTYRGNGTLQASATSTTSGPGDLLLNAKYEVIRDRHRGVAVGAEARLPSGSVQNLLGTGKIGGGPLVIASIGDQRTSVHGNLGYAVGGLSRSIDYTGAATFAASNRVTLIGELSGHRLANVGRLTETAAPNPSLVNVETVRLTSTNETISRVLAVAGVKWNFRSTWLLSANIVRPLTDAGLNASWTPTITLDHSFGL
jgi:hypothetical protein